MNPFVQKGCFFLFNSWSIRILVEDPGSLTPFSKLHGIWRANGICVRWILNMTLNKKLYLSDFFLAVFNTAIQTVPIFNSKGDIMSTVNINTSSTFYIKEPITAVDLMRSAACPVWILLGLVFLLNNTFEVANGLKKNIYILNNSL